MEKYDGKKKVFQDDEPEDDDASEKEKTDYTIYVVHIARKMRNVTFIHN